MKRRIVVPSSECINGLVPNHIMDVAKRNLLEIVVSDQYDKIEILSSPEIEQYDYDNIVKENYIWKFDMTNEFLELKNDIHINCKDSIIKPIIKETHKAYFRARFNEKGIFNFKLINSGKVLYEGKIEVTS